MEERQPMAQRRRGCPPPLKVTQLLGDYGHLHWAFGYYEPNQVDRDTRVDVARLV